jgi:hypothetical protein
MMVRRWCAVFAAVALVAVAVPGQALSSGEFEVERPIPRGTEMGASVSGNRNVHTDFERVSSSVTAGCYLDETNASTQQSAVMVARGLVENGSMNWSAEKVAETDRVEDTCAFAAAGPNTWATIWFEGDYNITGKVSTDGGDSWGGNEITIFRNITEIETAQKQRNENLHLHGLSNATFVGMAECDNDQVLTGTQNQVCAFQFDSNFGETRFDFSGRRGFNTMDSFSFRAYNSMAVFGENPDSGKCTMAHYGWATGFSRVDSDISGGSYSHMCSGLIGKNGDAHLVTPVFGGCGPSDCYKIERSNGIPSQSSDWSLVQTYPDEDPCNLDSDPGRVVGEHIQAGGDGLAVFACSESFGGNAWMMYNYTSQDWEQTSVPGCDETGGSTEAGCADRDPFAAGFGWFGQAGYADENNDLEYDSFHLSTSSGNPQDLPYDVVAPQESESAPTGLRDVFWDYKLSDPELWGRSVGTTSSINTKLWKWDENLTTQTETSVCRESNGFSDTFSNLGLGVTTDNLPVNVCEGATSTKPVLVVYDTFATPTSSMQTASDTVPVPVEAKTGNQVVYRNSVQTIVAEADVPAGVETTRSDDTYSVDVMPVSPGWVAHSGPAGTWVWSDSVNGDRIVRNTALTWDSVQVYDGEVWSHDRGSDELARWAVESGSLVQQESRSWSTPHIHALQLSHDGNYLAALGDDRVGVLNASSLDDPVRTSELSGSLETAALDGCNNMLAVATEGAVRTFDVANYTDCTGFGGTDSTASDGSNEPPSSEPFGDEDEETTDEGSEGEQLTGGEESISEGIGGFSAGAFADGFGVGEESAGWILGSLMIFGFAVAGVSTTGVPAAGVAGGVAGAGVALAFRWIPLWFFVLTGVMAAAVVVFGRGD